jgi:hypothetical protein
MTDDVAALAAAIKAKLDEKPAEVEFSDALRAAQTEILHGGSPRQSDAEPIEVLKREIHEEAESIRGVLEKFDRVKRLEKLVWEIKDRFGHRPDYPGGILPAEQERLEDLISELRQEIESDAETKEALARIERLQIFVDAFTPRAMGFSLA